MPIVIMVICVIVWLFIQAAMQDQGVQPRSRGSLRYQRRKARRLGLDPEDVPISPRSGAAPPPEPERSHVGDLAHGLLWGLGLVVLMIVGGFVIMGLGLPGDLFWAWTLALIVVGFLVRRR